MHPEPSSRVMAPDNESSRDGSNHRMSSTNRRATLSPTRRERKRTSDRESQRATRARTKAYIEHLEKSVRTLSAHNQSGEDIEGVSQQLSEQFEEIENLKNVLVHIAKLANGVEKLPRTQPEGSTASLPHHRAPKIIRPQILAAGTNGSDHGGGADLTTWNPASHPPQESLRDLFPELNVMCGKEERNYFDALNQSLLVLEHSCRPHRFTGLEVDDDIVIRAILHGWDVAKIKNPFDIGWQLLECIDRGLFHRSGTVERIAILRIIRSMLMERIMPNIPPDRRPPSYMNRSQLQEQVAHPRLVDYFVWPEVRDKLIIRNIDCAPESLATQFATGISFTWPYDVRDVCKYQVAKGMYTFSKEFNEAYHNVESWCLDRLIASILFPSQSVTINLATVADGGSSKSRDQQAKSLRQTPTHGYSSNTRIDHGSNFLPTSTFSDPYSGAVFPGGNQLGVQDSSASYSRESLILGNDDIFHLNGEFGM